MTTAEYSNSGRFCASSRRVQYGLTVQPKPEQQASTHRVALGRDDPGVLEVGEKNVPQVIQILGFAATTLVALGYFPQIIHLWKERCSAGISISA